MIDVQHKALKAIKCNLSEIESFFKDKSRIERIMGEPKTIVSWSKSDKTLMYQKITEDILSNYDINIIVQAFIELECFKEKSIDLDIFKAIAHEYYLFLKRVYEIYLLDQLYYLLASDIDINTSDFVSPFKTDSYYEKMNFEITLFQTSLNSTNEDVDIRLHNIKEFYLELINSLLKNKKYLYRKTYLNVILQDIVFSSDNYYAAQLFILMNDKILQNKSKKKSVPSKKANDEMQLILKSY